MYAYVHFYRFAFHEKLKTKKRYLWENPIVLMNRGSYPSDRSIFVRPSEAEILTIQPNRQRKEIGCLISNLFNRIREGNSTFHSFGLESLASR